VLRCGYGPSLAARLRLAALGGLAVATLLSCGNDDGDNADGGPKDSGSCVQGNLTSLHSQLFSTTRCAQAVCHADSMPGGNLDFSVGKAAVRTALLGMTDEPTAKLTYPNRVVASDPAMSYLFVKVSMAMPGGSLGRMPPGAPLDTCEIEAIRAWIMGGALDD
jgi:hypothetical protein